MIVLIVFTTCTASRGSWPTKARSVPSRRVASAVIINLIRSIRSIDRPLSLPGFPPAFERFAFHHHSPRPWG